MDQIVEKTAYVYGPIKIHPLERSYADFFYQTIANAYREVTGKEAFLHHKRLDAKKSHFTARETYNMVIEQLKQRTELLVVVLNEPSSTSGIVIQAAHSNNIPIIAVYHKNRSDLLPQTLRGIVENGRQIIYCDEVNVFDPLKVQFETVSALG